MRVATAELMRRAENLADELPLNEAVEVRWAARGLRQRLNLDASFARLDERVKGLPFEIVPGSLDWPSLIPGAEDGVVEALLSSIPFRHDSIVTRFGPMVRERRATAWVAEEGIGALAYSGKMMLPSPTPELVQSAMRSVEGTLGLDKGYFDCALCNYYPDGDAACKFYTDPEHGTFWDRLTCVVSAGEHRRFAFRPIPGVRGWGGGDGGQGRQPDTDTDTDTTPAVAHLFPGDVVKMWGKCNDDFFHAVYPAEGGAAGTAGRISLVFKRAIERGSKGQRGHGLPHASRKGRRKRTQRAGNE